MRSNNKAVNLGIFGKAESNANWHTFSLMFMVCIHKILTSVLDFKFNNLLPDITN